MRTRNSTLNVISNLLLEFLGILLTFIVRTIFIKYLGESYLGLNGLLTNILSMLSVAELGFGTAITFSLYEPLHSNDTKKISILMAFFKKAYFYIGLIILSFGIILSLFLPLLIKEAFLFDNINFIFYIYLLNSVFFYFISYKDILIVADQKNYRLAKINFIFKIAIAILEIISIIFFKNYIMYLLIQFILGILQRITINRFITKSYSNIDFNSKEKLSISDKKIITKNVKAMFFHKIGDYCVNGTDNIILSTSVSLSIVGIYSNYLLIINTINKFASTIFKSIVSSIGNLLVDNKNKNRNVEVFDTVNFMGFLIYGFSSLMLFYILNNFIIIWIGRKYIFNMFVVLLITLNFYFTGMRVPLSSFKSAAGIYDEDKYVPLIQSLINLIVSIALVKPLGIVGVLIGTLASSLLLPCWNRPYIVCKYAIKCSPKNYFISYTKYIFILLLDGLFLYAIFEYLNLSANILNIIILVIVITGVFISSIILFFRKSKEYKYIIWLIKKIGGKNGAK